MDKRALDRITLRSRLRTADSLVEAVDRIIYHDIYEDHDELEFRIKRPKGWYQLFDTFDIMLSGTPEYEVHVDVLNLPDRVWRWRRRKERFFDDLEYLVPGVRPDNPSMVLDKLLLSIPAGTGEKLPLPQRNNDIAPCSRPAAEKVLSLLTYLARVRVSDLR